LQGLRRLEWLLDHTGSHQGKTEVSSRESVSVLEKICAYEQKDTQNLQEVDWQNTLTQEEHEREVDILEAEIKKYKSLYEGLKEDVVNLSSSTTIHMDGRLQLNFEQYKKVVRLFPSEIKDDERR
jgi:archaellum component FlaC